VTFVFVQVMVIIIKKIFMAKPKYFIVVLGFSIPLCERRGILI